MPVNLNYLLNNNMKLIIALYIALCFSTSVYALDKSKYIQETFFSEKAIHGYKNTEVIFGSCKR